MALSNWRKFAVRANNETKLTPSFNWQLLKLPRRIPSAIRPATIRFGCLGLRWTLAKWERMVDDWPSLCLTFSHQKPRSFQWTGENSRERLPTDDNILCWEYLRKFWLFNPWIGSIVITNFPIVLKVYLYRKQRVSLERRHQSFKGCHGKVGTVNAWPVVIKRGCSYVKERVNPLTLVINYSPVITALCQQTGQKLRVLSIQIRRVTVSCGCHVWPCTDAASASCTCAFCSAHRPAQT